MQTLFIGGHKNDLSLSRKYPLTHGFNISVPNKVEKAIDAKLLLTNFIETNQFTV
jgi:hypothetical protein